MPILVSSRNRCSLTAHACQRNVGHRYALQRSVIASRELGAYFGFRTTSSPYPALHLQEWQGTRDGSYGRQSGTSPDAGYCTRTREAHFQYLILDGPIRTNSGQTKCKWTCCYPKKKTLFSGWGVYFLYIHDYFTSNTLSHTPAGILAPQPAFWV
jgi:hypothetical protein